MILGPIIKIEIDNIKQMLHHAFADYQEQFSNQMGKEIERVLSEPTFSTFIANEVKTQIELSSKAAIKSYFEYGPGRKAIDDAIYEAMKQK